MAGHFLTTSTRISWRAGRTHAIGPLALALMQVFITPAASGDDCPDISGAPSAETFSVVDNTSPEDPIQFEADSFEATKDGDWLLLGDVTLTQGQRHISTRNATYNPASQSIKAEEGLTYTGPNLVVRGRDAEIEQGGKATFEGAEFELPAIHARGGAERIRAATSGELDLDSVRYTTCPVGNDDWSITAANINLSQTRRIGTGRGVRLDFKGVPLLYAPYFSFPIGNERKSGFLYPILDTSGSSGTGLSVPWYWNIAPNYDATFEPAYYSKRGFKLGTEFRYLTGIGRGIFDARYLPDDNEFGDSRSLIRFTDKSDLSRHVRLDIDAANVSDSKWFEDFGNGPEGTSTLYLNRLAEVTYLTDHWRAIARAQNLQTIADETIPPRSRPYTLLPQLAVTGYWPRQPYGITLGFDLEITDFEHNFFDPAQPLPTGLRLDVAPEIRLPLRAAGIYVEPSASWRYTAYKLKDVAPGQDDSPDRSAPIVSVDAGMAFEHDWGSRQQRLQTFEPRFMYLYVPFREQDQIPVFDTAAADLNLVQLFRTNRFVGADRLSNANQIAIGVTSRLLDSDTGQQFITGTVGQQLYFHTPQVTLPGEVLDDTESSDIVAELGLTAFSNWNVHMGVQWDPGETRSEKGDVSVQYRTDGQHVMNVGYRFRRDVIEQVDGSVAWPVSEKWSAYGRLVYSLDDNTAINQFAGVEYRSCCWRVRAVARRFVRNREGDTDTSFMLQLELNGLSSVGNADAFLERSIGGYSFESTKP